MGYSNIREMRKFRYSTFLPCFVLVSIVVFYYPYQKKVFIADLTAISEKINSDFFKRFNRIQETCPDLYSLIFSSDNDHIDFCNKSHRIQNCADTELQYYKDLLNDTCSYVLLDRQHRRMFNDLKQSWNSNHKDMNRKNMIMCILRKAVPLLDDADYFANQNIMKLLDLDHLLPKESLANWSRRQKYHTCAVVYSSPYLLKYNHGDLIDSHDGVIRFNAIPIRGFEKHVGTKTTLHVMNMRNFFNRFKIKDTFYHPEIESLIWYSLKDLDFLRNLRQDMNANNIDHPGDITDYFMFQTRAEVPHLRLLKGWFSYQIRKTFDIFNYTLLSENSNFVSSGTIGLLIALNVCHKVNIFGAYTHHKRSADGTYWALKSSRLHYYETSAPRKLLRTTYYPIKPEEHAFVAEHEFLKDITDNSTEGILSLDGFSELKCS